MDAIALKLCDIQGRLFELSARKGYDSAAFVKAFMIIWCGVENLVYFIFFCFLWVGILNFF